MQEKNKSGKNERSFGGTLGLILGAVFVVIVILILSMLMKSELDDYTTETGTESIVAEAEDIAGEEAAAESVADTGIDVDAEVDTEVDSDVDSEVDTEVDSKVDSDVDTNTDADTVDGEDVVSYFFRNEKLKEQHYQKHGVEMGFDSADAYEEAASAVVNNPEALHKTEAEDGDDVYYVESTNEFVIVSTDGFIRTYFLPNGGRSYYDRQ